MDKLLSATEYANRAGITLVEAFTLFREEEYKPFLVVEKDGKTYVKESIFGEPQTEEETTAPASSSSFTDFLLIQIEEQKNEIEHLKQEIKEKQEKIEEYGLRFAALAEQSNSIAVNAQTLQAAEKKAILSIAEKPSLIKRLFSKDKRRE